MATGDYFVFFLFEICGNINRVSGKVLAYVGSFIFAFLPSKNIHSLGTVQLPPSHFISIVASYTSTKCTSRKSNISLKALFEK